MAGIGFELQKLSEKRGLFGQLSAVGHGAIIAAGPWIFTILAIGLITVVTERSLGLTALSDFRAVIIYAFSLSLVFTAPVVIIATRMVSDAIYSRRLEVVSHIFFAAITLGLVCTLVPTLVAYVGVFGLSFPNVVAGTMACCLVGMIWISLAFCGAVRDYNGITAAFLAGLFVAIAGAVVVSALGFGAVELVWMFNCGLTITLFWLMSRVLLTFPDAVTHPVKAIILFVRTGGLYWRLALASVFSVLAIWIDKWIMWLGPAGERLPNGLLHSPLYDSAMFTAYLVIIPSLSLFIIDLETSFFMRYQRYFADISGHATLSQIRDNAKGLAQQVQSSLQRIFLVQAMLCAIMILLSPIIIDALDMQYRQAAILRFGVFGALFQFLFLASSSLLLFFNREWYFFGLQLVFLVLNGGLTFGAILLGPTYYGFGYLIACLVSSVLSLIVLKQTLDDVDYLTFLSAVRVHPDGNWLSKW